MTAGEREFAQKEKTLQATREYLAEAISLETNVHMNCARFFQQKVEALNEQKSRQEHNDKEKKEKEDELGALRENRGNGFELLTDLQNRKNDKILVLRAREEDQKRFLYVENQRREEEYRIQQAIEYLQREGRLYMERLRIRNAARKGGKKAKKGKKK